MKSLLCCGLCCFCWYVCDYKGGLCSNFDERVEKVGSFCEEIVIRAVSQRGRFCFSFLTPGDGVRGSKK